MDPRRGDAEARYRIARSKVYAQVRQQLKPLDRSAHATSINSKTLKCWRDNWIPLHGTRPEHGDWNWEHIRDMYQSVAKRLDVAVWVGEVLCGLIAGKASDGRNHVSVEYVEGWVGNHPLKGRMLEIADIAATAFALQIESRKVRIVNPAPHLVEAYGALGYKSVNGCRPPCMEREILA